MPVARPPERHADVLFQWPSPLQPSDTVNVGEGDACVSMQHGNVLGIFSPGVHPLPAAIPEGVELWFCCTRPVVGNKFGGRTPSGTMFGDYGFQITAPHLVVTNLVGAGSASDVVRYLNTTVVKALTMACGIKPPDPSTMMELQDKARAGINEQWQPLGVKFLEFGMLQFQ